MVRSIVAAGTAQHTNPVPNAAVHRGVLMTSGILGKAQETDTYPPDLAEQSALCFAYLRQILREAGAGLDDVVKLDLYLLNRSDRATVNADWLACWPDEMRRPARQVHIADLPEGCLIQVTATAIVAPEGPGLHDR